MTRRARQSSAASRAALNVTAGLTVTLGLALAVIASTAGTVAAQEGGSRIVLNGETARVRWSDGDSFRILDGAFANTGVRLSGYNTLESYGPIHRWGEWTAVELYALANQSTEFVRAGTWTCTTGGERDHYDRLLVDCPGLTLAMAASGFGHLFAIDTPAAPDAIAAQAGAQAAHLGIWAKGVPTEIVSSLHSAAEGGEVIYNRLISTADGSSRQLIHAETYETCQEVCLEEAGSCLVYVPFEQRYGNTRADCLRVRERP
jgi:micrococcal nuclease